MRRVRVRSAVFALVLALLVLVVAGGAWLRTRLRGSLPVLDGQMQLTGLASPVTVTRDSLGIPTIRGSSREDVARATGFLHAQDRFFQMDITRRRAAGELAALVGARAIPIDRQARLHRFRAEASAAVQLLPAADRAVLDAYTQGVNAGLTALSAPPFEYLLLRQQPQPWRPEDTMLVVLSMFMTLQDDAGGYESARATMQEILPPAVAAFLDPRGTEWDSPVEGDAFTMPPIPGPEVYDLRTRRRGKPPATLPPRRPEVVRGPSMPAPPRRVATMATPTPLDPLLDTLRARPDDATGSNNWVVSGALTANGLPLLANDMHLAVRVPNTWYRASFEWPDSASASEPHRLTGVTLPGTPAMVVGSNTHIAWGFTNTYADWSDIVLLEIDPANPDRYRTPEGWRTFEHHDEVIRVAGGSDEHVGVTWTIWGPLLAPDYRGRPRAYRWVAYSAERLGGTVTPLESARTVDQAFDAANGLGTPGQNMVVADENGHIGWSVFGSIPRRTGFDGGLPTSWADGSRGWQGWLQPSEYPRIIDPPGGRIWTANARVVGGDMLARLGDGSYEVGSRARIIRDRLAAQTHFTPRDFLDIQLDARADFLARWRELALRTLTPAVVAGNQGRAAFRDVIASRWSGTVTPDSAAYRLIRMFRERVSEHAIAFVLADCYDADPAFDYLTVRRREGPLWALVSQQPPHLLDPAYASWPQLLAASIDEVVALVGNGRDGTLAQQPWSDYNVTAYRHPLSSALPLVGRWLDMPRTPLPGDLYTPNMHWGANAASERMIVSPGREAEAIMHMPTGQSGNPLSPFYANSHPAWVRGEATPFLPGPANHTLTLSPH